MRVLLSVIGSLMMLACGDILAMPEPPTQAEKGPSLSAVVTGGSAGPSSEQAAAPSNAATATADAPDAGAVLAPVDAGCVPIEHDTGTGHTYRSCSPLGAFDRDAAMRACRAYLAISGGSMCGGTCSSTAVTSIGGTSTGSWAYTGDFAGRVRVVPGTSWECPDETSPTWN